jgi:hypothetical protein
MLIIKNRWRNKVKRKGVQLVQEKWYTKLMKDAKRDPFQKEKPRPKTPKNQKPKQTPPPPPKDENFL